MIFQFSTFIRLPPSPTRLKKHKKNCTVPFIVKKHSFIHLKNYMRNNTIFVKLMNLLLDVFLIPLHRFHILINDPNHLFLAYPAELQSTF